MPLGFKFLERLPGPEVGNHVGVIRHQFSEAVELGGIDGVGVTEAFAK